MCGAGVVFKFSSMPEASTGWGVQLLDAFGVADVTLLTPPPLHRTLVRLHLNSIKAGQQLPLSPGPTPVTASGGFMPVVSSVDLLAFKVEHLTTLFQLQKLHSTEWNLVYIVVFNNDYMCWIENVEGGCHWKLWFQHLQGGYVKNYENTQAF
jgi:hypothetical protein